MANILRAREELMRGGEEAEGPVVDGAQNPRDGGLKRLAFIIWRHKYLALAACLTVVVFGAIDAYWLERDVYEATSRVLITRNLVGDGALDAVLNLRPYVSNKSLAKIASLEPTVQRAMTYLRVWAKKEEGECPLADAPDELSPEEEALLADEEGLAGLVGGVRVEPDNDNVAIDLTAYGPYEDLTGVAADALAYAVRDEFEHKRAMQSNVRLLREQIRGNDERLEALERDIVQLRANLTGGELEAEALPLDPDRQREVLSSYAREIEHISRDVASSGEKVRLLDMELRKHESDKWGMLPPAHLSSRLAELELKRDGYRRRYTPRNPKLLQLEREIALLRAEIEKSLGDPKTYGGQAPYAYVAVRANLRSQLATEKAKLHALTRRVEQARAATEKIRERMFEQIASGLSAKIESRTRAKRVYESIAVMLETQLRKVELGSGPGDGNFLEVVPSSPRLTGPHRLQVLIVALVFGLLCGSALALAIDRLDESVRAPADIRQIVGAPTLGVVPEIEEAPFIRPENPSSRSAEVFAVLRNHIRYSARDNPEKCLLITSALPEEGKSFIATNLAISFAQEGNSVALVDADLRRTTPHLIQEAIAVLSPPQGGLGQLLAGGEMSRALIPTEMPNLFFIPSGGRAENPPKTLRSEAMTELLRKLEAEHDVVIVDTPPVLDLVDATILAPRVRAVLQVSRYGYVRKEEAAEGAQRLRHVGAPLVGCVLNRAPRPSSSYYYSYYARA